MKFYIGNTDYSWYNYLNERAPEDVNFWRPGGVNPFKVLEPLAPFLFKLKAPYNPIAGVGFFSCFTTFPLSIAWDVFNNRNGCESLDEFRKKISFYRTNTNDPNPVIGCIVLTDPIFFKREDWLPAPENWAPSIVQGKSYQTTERIGGSIWRDVERRLFIYQTETADARKSQLILEDVESPAYRTSALTKVRLGQGAFRTLITDAYSRKCTISGEKTLPLIVGTISHSARFEIGFIIDLSR